MLQVRPLRMLASLRTVSQTFSDASSVRVGVQDAQLSEAEPSGHVEVSRAQPVPAERVKHWLRPQDAVLEAFPPRHTF